MLETWSQIEDRVKTIITRVLHVRPEEVTLRSAFLDDLGADSLDTIELIMEFEQEFEMDIPDETAEKIRRVEDILDLMAQLFPQTPRDLIDSRVIAFRIREDGRIQVGLQQTDGTWLYADGTSLLPSGLYLTVFSRWANVLKELEEMINSPEVAEADLQRFFERYPDLLKGDEYDLVIPQARITSPPSSEWQADFVLHPLDQTAFCKVLELKLPSIPTARSPKSGHPRFFAQLRLAIDQLRDYGAAFQDEATRSRFKEAYGVEVYSPDLHLIAGRRWAKAYMDKLLELQRRSDIRISDWDSHLETLRRKFT